MAVARFPGEFDWVYSVISRLASTRHNPDGARWLTGSLLVAAIFLWPVIGHLDRWFSSGQDRPRLSLAALRMGLVGAGLLAIEGLTSLDLSRIARKAHEALALITFIALYLGIIGLYVRRIRTARTLLWPALIVVLPLFAVGVTQLFLYLGQRDLGWVNTDWREIGIPFWLSLAFWQWLAVAFLAVGLGILVASAASRPDPEPAPPTPDPS